MLFPYSFWQLEKNYNWSGHSYVGLGTISLSGLLAYYSFDKSNNLGVDSYTGHHHLLTGGTPTAVGGIINTALSTPTSSSFLSGDGTPFINTSGVSFSVISWFYVTNTSVPTNYVMENVGRWGFIYHGSGDIQGSYVMGCFMANGANQGVDIYPPLNVGSWNLVCFWYDKPTSTMNAQVNNGVVLSTGIVGIGQVGATNVFSIGIPPSSSVQGLYVDEVSIWARTLSDTERNLLWNGGAGYPYPFNN